VLFSEPKIPQLFGVAETGFLNHVSVLFSEPKIPQCDEVAAAVKAQSVFQCSSASRKFLNVGKALHIKRWLLVSVLFSEPKIPQCSINDPSRARQGAFQCSSASRKFLNNQPLLKPRALGVGVSVLFSEPKIPQ